MITRIEGEILTSNTYVVSNGKECFVVDAGARVDALKQHIKGQKVLGIFLTHGHYDHIYFLDNYLSELGCKAYASEFAKEYLEESNKNLSEQSVYKTMYIKNIDAVNFLKNSGVVKLGNFEVKYFQLGGHSTADMMFDFDGNIFVGDTIIGRDVGRQDMYGGDKSAMVKSLGFLENYDYKIMYSGHGTENKKETQDSVVKLWKKFLSR